MLRREKGKKEREGAFRKEALKKSGRSKKLLRKRGEASMPKSFVAVMGRKRDEIEVGLILEVKWLISILKP